MLVNVSLATFVDQLPLLDNFHIYLQRYDLGFQRRASGIIHYWGKYFGCKIS